MTTDPRALLDAMQARCDEHVDSMDGREDRWHMDLVNDSIRLIAVVRAVMAVEPQYSGLDLALGDYYYAQAYNGALADVARAVTAALDADS